MDKRQRNYELIAGTETDLLTNQVEIRMPFTLEFDVTRNLLASASTSSFRIYNLSLENQNRLRWDRYRTNEYRPIEVRAGYGDVMPLIFKGNIQSASSVRQGVDVITTIEAFDTGFALANGQVSTSFPKGTPVNSVLDEILKTLPHAEKGAIGNFPGNTQRANTFSGNSAEIIQQLSNGAMFTDLERVYILNDDEVIEGALQVVTAETGLLNTPLREETQIVFDMLFEPRLMIGQGLELISEREPRLNGIYKVVSIKHRGTISEAVCGSAITTVGLWLGPGQLKKVNLGVG